jgi:large subunit ribosomal protein L30
MAKIKITQKRSVIGRSARQKATMDALGLRKMNASVEVEATPQGSWYGAQGESPCRGC